MGTCDYCDQDAVVTVNDRHACGAHIDAAFRNTLAPVQQAIQELEQ